MTDETVRERIEGLYLSYIEEKNKAKKASSSKLVRERIEGLYLSY
jgi:hypothetical protein